MISKKVLISLSLILSACAPLREESGPEKIEAYEVSLDQNLSALEDGLTGKGKIKFTSPLLGINSRENYSIRFRFLNQKDSRLVLHSHSSGFEFEDGVQLELYPESDTLMLRISTPGFPSQTPIELMPVETGQEVSLKIEVHDGVSSGVRVIIWNDRVSYQGEVLRKQDRIFLGNHIFDSFEENLNFFSHGRGMFWGLELAQTYLLAAQRQLAYVD